MKNILCLLPILLLTQNIFATQARVEGMGKRPAFFLDDVTMFDNPANATFYPNALFGELGFFSQDALKNEHIGINQDPYMPWFGALFKYGLSDKGLRDPQITIGGFFGRENYDFTRFVPKKVVLLNKDTVAIPQSVTNFDAFLAGTMLDGSAVGAHIYVGVQDGKQNEGDLDGNAHVSILAMDYGANFLISNQSSMEVTLGVARIQYGPSRKTFLDPGLFSFYSQGRLFLEMDAWTGQFVTGYKVADMEVPGWREKFGNFNMGFNVIIPRGLLWVGLDGVYINETVTSWDRGEDNSLIYKEQGLESHPEDYSEGFGGILSFGMERNILGSKLLIVRIGGQKAVMYKTCENNSGSSALCGKGKGKGNYWTTNPVGDGSLDDHVGFGLGFNFERRLKIDLTIAEDLFFRNPFSGEGRFISRVAAVYTF
jgi:hypothetical protein